MHDRSELDSDTVLQAGFEKARCRTRSFVEVKLATVRQTVDSSTSDGSSNCRALYAVATVSVTQGL